MNLPLSAAIEKAKRGPLKVMADPVNEGYHPFHDSRFIATADATVEWSPHVENDWSLETGSLICNMRDVDPANAALLVHYWNTYAELRVALEELCHFIETTGPDDMEAFHGLGVQISARARSALLKTATVSLP